MEMRERVYELIPSVTDRANLTTFHGFAADVLRQHGSHLGISPDFSILNADEDRSEIFSDAIEYAIQRGELYTEQDKALLPLLTNLIEKRVREKDFERRIRDTDLAFKLASLSQLYRRELQQHNALDFPLLISLACDLLSDFPAAARHFRLVYPQICVDEFQDTNLSQFELLTALVGTDPSGLFVVADDDQIVYQWNGASPERIEDLRKKFNMSTLELPQNYRCPASIIEIANNLISHNSNRTKQGLPVGKSNGKGSTNAIRALSFISPEQEASWIAKDIASLPIEAREFCAVLGRTRNLVEGVANALSKSGVSFTTSVKKNEFLSSPMKWLHSMLRLANARGDREQLRKACSAFYDLEGVKLVPKDVLAASSAMGGDLFRAFITEALARRSSLDSECISLLMVPAQNLADRMQYQDFVTKSFEWFDVLKSNQQSSATAESFTDYNEESAVWHNLCDSICSRYGAEDLSLNILLQELDLMPKQAPPPPNAVRCYTIHTAKGMEFDHVYVVGMAEDLLPSYQSTRRGATSKEVEEERRSCFVAITRTRKTLTLTRSLTYFGYPKRPSRFLTEMGLA